MFKYWIYDKKKTDWYFFSDFFYESNEISGYGNEGAKDMVFVSIKFYLNRMHANKLFIKK